MKDSTVAGFKKYFVAATDCRISWYKEKTYCNRLHFETFSLLLFYVFINVLIIPKGNASDMYQIRFHFLSLLFILFSIKLYAQPIAKFTVHNVDNAIESPVYIELDNITSVADSALVFNQLTGNKKIPVQFQVEHSYHRFLWWMVKKNGSSKAENLVFELSKGKRSENKDFPIKVETRDGGLLLTDNGKNVLNYNFKTVYPPEGVDTVFKRSGFIHPLWSPDGHVLTQINPPDHRHHVGIWNPWTDVLFEGKMVDFWNLVKKEGTVRFSKFISKTEGPVFGGFKYCRSTWYLKTR